MIHLNELFPHKVCINLDRRTDRWSRVRTQFERHGIRDVQRIPATDGSTIDASAHWQARRGALGCLRSHVAAVRQARRDRLPHLLVFEDDVVFAPDFNSRFANSARFIPDDWDMFFLGGSHRKQPELLRAEIARLKCTLATHAYALKSTIFEAFLELNGRERDVVDINNTSLQERFQCYGFFPNLTWQEAGYSDVLGIQIDPWTIVESLVTDSDLILDLLSRTAVVLSYRPAVGTTSQSRRNLRFLLDRFMEILPAAAIIVVEPNDSHALASDDLPKNCHYLRARSGDERNAWLEGTRRFGNQKTFFVLCESTLYIPPQIIRAALQMCQRFDCIDAAAKIQVLSGDETDCVVDSGGRWHPCPQPTTSCEGAGCWITSRSAAEHLGCRFAGAAAFQSHRIDDRKSRFSTYALPVAALKLAP